MTEQLALGYASTVHSVHGRTADTAHAVVTPRTSPASLYVGLSRGRQANTAYVTTVQVPDDSPPGQASTVERRDPAAVLADILDRDDGNAAALQIEADSALDDAIAQADVLRPQAGDGDSAVAVLLERHDRLKEWAEAVEVYVREKGMKNLAGFIHVVTKNNLARQGYVPFTDYVAANWPTKPQEFFAQSFYVWRTDPNYMKRNMRPLFAWFEKGGHRETKDLVDEVREAAPVIYELGKEAKETFWPGVWPFPCRERSPLRATDPAQIPNRSMASGFWAQPRSGNGMAGSVVSNRRGHHAAPVHSAWRGEAEDLPLLPLPGARATAHSGARSSRAPTKGEGGPMAQPRSVVRRTGMRAHLTMTIRQTGVMR